jgi:L-2,4-diaminobutyrate transaminase
LVESREGPRFFDASRKIGPQVVAAMLKQGVIARAMPQGDILGFAPPFVITQAEIERVVTVAQSAVREVLG